MPDALDVVEITRKLDRLSGAYTRAGVEVERDLLPGLTDDEIVAHTSEWFPHPLPTEVLALYRWRNGQDELLAEHHFFFRDNQFISLDDARSQYETEVEVFGGGDAPSSHWPRAHFPFASNNGALYTFDCSPGAQLIDGLRPVLDRTAPWYDSLSTLLDTCIAWVTHPLHEPYGGSPEFERDADAIWRQLNPKANPWVSDDGPVAN